MADYIDIDVPIPFTEYYHGKKIDVTIRHILEANKAEYNLADVAPVKHGEWVVSEDDNKVFGCSECHHVVFGKPNFCSNCGARMDGGT